MRITLGTTATQVRIGKSTTVTALGLRYMKDAVEAWKEDPSRQTDYQIARIMLAYGMHRMTDLYGDIPYSQAVQPELYSFPEYDTQQSIYMDLLEGIERGTGRLERRIGGGDEIGGQLLSRRCLEVEEVCQLTDAARGDAYVEGRPGRGGAMGEDRGSQRGV